MSDFSKYPEGLRDVLEAFAESPADRNAMLIDYSDQFSSVPDDIAKRPYPPANRVPHCESDSYVFVEPLDSGKRLNFHIAVENPFGVSARALSAILESTINGLSSAEIAAMPIDDIVPTLFGPNISMGKGQGLMGIAAMIKALAQRYAQAQ
ncbi:MAG: SufE family protein [Chloroflexi bacterium]|nr:SufE family protein [Chloroflexota bacterium]MCL5274487.1 SufE family protein [Chloroflexota bacterium]